MRGWPRHVALIVWPRHVSMIVVLSPFGSFARLWQGCRGAGGVQGHAWLTDCVHLQRLSVSSWSCPTDTAKHKTTMLATASASLSLVSLSRSFLLPLSLARELGSARSVCRYACLCVCLPVCLSVCLSVSLSLSRSPLACALSHCLSFSLSLSLSFPLFPYLSMSLFSLSPPLSLSFSFSLALTVTLFLPLSLALLLSSLSLSPDERRRTEPLGHRGKNCCVHGHVHGICRMCVEYGRRHDDCARGWYGVVGHLCILEYQISFSHVFNADPAHLFG